MIVSGHAPKLQQISQYKESYFREKAILFFVYINFISTNIYIFFLTTYVLLTYICNIFLQESASVVAVLQIFLFHNFLYMWLPFFGSSLTFTYLYPFIYIFICHPSALQFVSSIAYNQVIQLSFNL